MPDLADLSVRLRVVGGPESSNAVDAVSRALRRSAQASSIQERANKKLERAEKSLARAQQSRGRNTQLVERLTARMTKAQERARRAGQLMERQALREARALRGLSGAAAGAAADLDDVAVASARTARGFGGNSFAITNAANQFSDLAVQIGAGTSPLRALSQQVPQLTAFMGPMAAVAGVATGVLFGLADALFRNRGEVEESTTSFEDMADALGDLDSAFDADFANLDTLTEKFGAFASLVRQSRIEVRNFAVDQAEASTRTLFSGLVDTSRGEGVLGASSQPLLAQFGITRGDNLERVVRLRQDVRIAERRAEANEREARDLEAQGGFLSGARRARTRADASVLGVRRARGALSQENPQLVRLVELLEQYDAQASTLSGRQRSDRILEIQRTTNQLPEGVLNPSVRESIIQGGLTGVETLGQLDNGPRFAEGIEEANEALKEGSKAAREFSRDFENTFVSLTHSVIDGTLTIGEAFNDLVDSVIEDIAERAFRQAIARPLADGVTGLLGGIIPGGIPAAASGGVVDGPHLFTFGKGGSGNLGLLGEAGPEAIMPLSRGSDGRLGVRAAGGMSAPRVIINDYSSGSKSHKVEGDGRGGVNITLEDMDQAVAQAILSDGATSRALHATTTAQERLS